MLRLIFWSDKVTKPDLRSFNKVVQTGKKKFCMKNYKLTIAYDGTDYFGWQEQKDKPSITSALKQAFEFTFEKKVNLLGASRTDAGVHAMGQVGWFKTNLDIDVKKMNWAWSNVIPADITIRSLNHVDPTFHPYYNVDYKIYYYHFFSERPLPFMQRYGWYYPYKIDHCKLKEALQFFVGTHDFCSFRSAEDVRENTIRTIDIINLKYLTRFNTYRITIKGKKFLRHMIRRLIGASLSVAAKQNTPIATLTEIMNAKNPNHSLPNAPAQGLMLYKIKYKN